MQFTLTLDTSEHTIREIINRCIELKNKGLIENYTLSPKISNNIDSFNLYNAFFIFPKNTMKFIPDDRLRKHPVIKKMCDIIYKDGGYIEKVKGCDEKDPAFKTIISSCSGDYIFIDFVSGKETITKIDDLCFDKENSPEILRYKIIRREPLE